MFATGPRSSAIKSVSPQRQTPSPSLRQPKWSLTTRSDTFRHDANADNSLGPWGHQHDEIAIGVGKRLCCGKATARDAQFQDRRRGRDRQAIACMVHLQHRTVHMVAMPLHPAAKLQRPTLLHLLCCDEGTNE